MLNPTRGTKISGKNRSQSSPLPGNVSSHPTQYKNEYVSSTDFCMGVAVLQRHPQGTPAEMLYIQCSVTASDFSSVELSTDQEQGKAAGSRRLAFGPDSLPLGMKKVQKPLTAELVVQSKPHHICRRVATQEKIRCR